MIGRGRAALWVLAAAGALTAAFAPSVAAQMNPGQFPGSSRADSVFAPDPNLKMPTFRESTSVVVVPTLVEERNGDVVRGLKPDDFAIYDDGEKQKAQVDDPFDARPMSLLICVERGRQASQEFSKIRHLGSLLQRLAANPSGGMRDRVALVAFDSRPVWVEPFSGNTASIAKDLGTMPAGDAGAAILDAVGYSVNLLEQQPRDRRRILLLISEPHDHGSSHFSIPELVERIGTSNTLVLSLTFSPSKTELNDRARRDDDPGAQMNVLAPLLTTVEALRKNAPRTLAALSGGEYIPFTHRKDFEQGVAEAVTHARNRYLLRFRPTDPTPGLHTVQVKLTRDSGARVIARNSYWALLRDGSAPSN